MVEVEPTDEEPTLESPTSAGELYYACGEDTPIGRPHLTGDILTELELPGLEDGAGFAILLTHPCAMRKDGVHLADKIFAARVRPYQEVRLDLWSISHFKVMPLPGLDLVSGADPAALFNEASLVRSDNVLRSKRVACLSEYGINLLQQRLVYHLTRFAVPTSKLHGASAQVFREVELQEEWVTRAIERNEDHLIARQNFHAWLRSTEGAEQPTRQARLADAQQAAGVRREMRALVK